MQMYKYVLFLLIAVGCVSAPSFAADPKEVFDLDQETVFQRELNERDYNSVIEFLKTRRADEKTEKFKWLTLSGDMRVEWRHITEKGILNNEYEVLRGRQTRHNPAFLIPVSRNDTDIEFNLRIDYHKERTWALAHLQFDNGGGTGDFNEPCGRDSDGCQGSGQCDDVCLKRCYIGYNVYSDDCQRFDIELGRRKLYDIFDSYIQFLARFDGLLLKYTSKDGSAFDFYWYTGGFLVDERVDHYAGVTEFGFINIVESGLDLKYSFIYWPRIGLNRCHVYNPQGWRFANSQFTAEYNLDKDLLCTPVQFYAAVLYNHMAKKIHVDPFKHHGHRGKKEKFPWGWYAGVWIGEVKGEGDWSLDMNYQYVQAQAVADCDIAGIGRGNILDLSFPTNRQGNANYQGFCVEFLYALTDNLSFDTVVEYSTAIDKSIGMGGPHKYSDFKIEAIYAW